MVQLCSYKEYKQSHTDRQEPSNPQATMSFAGPQEPRALEVMSPSGLGATAGLLSSPTLVGETAGPNYGSLTVGAGTDGTGAVGAGTDGAGAIGTGAVVVGPVQGGDLSIPAVADGQTNSGVLGSGDPGVTGGLEMEQVNDNWPVVEKHRVLESSNGGLETALAAERFGAVQMVQTAMEGTANAGSPTAASRTTGLEMRYVQTGTGAYGWMTRLTDFLRATTTGGGGLGDRMLGSLGLTPNQAPGTPRSHSSRAAAVAATPQSAARQSPWNFSPPEELQVMTQHVEGGGHPALFDQRAVERMNSWPSRGPLLHGEQTSQGSTGSSEIRVEVQRQLGQYMRDRDQVQTEVVALRRQVQELMNAGFGRQSGGEAEQGVGRVPGGPQVPGDDPLHGVPHGGGSSLHGTSRAQGGLSGAGVPQVPQGPQLHGVSGGPQGPQLPGVSGGLITRSSATWWFGRSTRSSATWCFGRSTWSTWSSATWRSSSSTRFSATWRAPADWKWWCVGSWPSSWSSSSTWRSSSVWRWTAKRRGVAKECNSWPEPVGWFWGWRCGRFLVWWRDRRSAGTGWNVGRRYPAAPAGAAEHDEPEGGSAGAGEAWDCSFAGIGSSWR